MLRVEDAVNHARTFLPGLLFDTPHQIADVRLEEVELSDDERFWSVTFSYVQADSTSPIVVRQYKTVRIKADNGDFVGLRNGYLASV